MSFARRPARPTRGGITLDTELFINRFVDAVEYEGEEILVPETRLDSLEIWSSLAALSTIAMISTDYEVEVPGRVLKACEKVGDIIDFVSQEVGAEQA